MNKVHLGVWNTILRFCYSGDPILLQYLKWHDLCKKKKKKKNFTDVFQAPEDTLTCATEQGEDNLLF